MASNKTHYQMVGAERPACGRKTDSPLRVMSDQKYAHPSGRLMSAAETKGAIKRVVTCAGCLKKI